jgi:hypothetical protein
MTATTIKILYNDCFGSFGFSAALQTEYKGRTGHDMNPDQRLYLTGADSLRRDPVAIALVEERGTEWSSAEGGYIVIREIPAIFEHYWSIEEYSGNETVHVNVSEAYADLLHTYMDHGDLGRLVEGYRRVKTAAGRLLGSQLLKPSEIGGGDHVSSRGAGAGAGGSLHGGEGGGGFSFFNNGDEDDTDAHD